MAKRKRARPLAEGRRGEAHLADRSVPRTRDQTFPGETPPECSNASRGHDATLPLLALLFVPILFGLHELYPWDQQSPPTEVIKKAAYLNRGFFIARAVFYFLLWSVLAWKLRALSLKQDGTADPTPTRRLLTLSGPGVVLVPLSGTFAYIDWVMSMEPRWHSTIFALVLLAGQTLPRDCYRSAVISR